MAAVTANIDNCKAWEEPSEFIRSIVCNHTPYTELPVFKKKKKFYAIHSQEWC